jgi:hypothetical protein
VLEKNLKKILFSLILLFSTTLANASDMKDTYMEVLGIIKLYCKIGQYFNPPKKQLIRANLEMPVIGMCETDKEDYFKIYIDSGFWLQSSKDIQFQLMAHEMSHCLFFRNHVDNPKNFMYYAIRNQTKDKTKEQLIANLNEDCGKKDGK